MKKLFKRILDLIDKWISYKGSIVVLATILLCLGLIDGVIWLSCCVGSLGARTFEKKINQNTSMLDTSISPSDEA
jgi:hypothetical protein